jgi:hypothetical protein
VASICSAFLGTTPNLRLGKNLLVQHFPIGKRWLRQHTPNNWDINQHPRSYRGLLREFDSPLERFIPGSAQRPYLTPVTMAIKSRFPRLTSCGQPLNLLSIINVSHPCFPHSGQIGIFHRFFDNLPQNYFHKSKTCIHR